MEILNHSFFENVDDLLRTECIENCKADPNSTDADLRSLEDELNAIVGNAYSPYFMLMKLVFDLAIEERCIVFSDRPTSALMTSYYFGISYVKPTELYDPRIALGYHFDRMPLLSVTIPIDFLVCLEKKFKEIFGSEKVAIYDGFLYIGVPDPTQTKLHDIYRECIGIGVEKSALLSELNTFQDLDENAFRSVVRNMFSISRYSSGGIHGNLIKSDEGSLTRIRRIVKEYALDAPYCDSLIKNNIERVINGISSFESLLICVAAIRGNGVYEANRDELSGMLSLDGYYTRDDLFEAMKRQLNDDGLAFIVTDKTRKGMARLAEVQKQFSGFGLNDDVIEKLSKIRYLAYEGDALPLAELFCYKAGCFSE